MLAKTHSPRGLTVLELLVTMSSVGIVFAVVLPAMGVARESSRRVACSNKLRELGLALHCHHNAKSCLPTGWQWEPSGTTAYGWAVPLLPYIGQPDLRDAINLKLPVGDPRNRVSRETLLAQMMCPSDIVEPSFMLLEDDENLIDETPRTSKAWGTLRADRIALLRLPSSNYVGVHGTVEPADIESSRGQHPTLADGTFPGDVKIQFRDFQRGLARTFVVGERTMAQASSTWYGVDRRGEDSLARLVGSALEGINQTYGEECDFSSRHPGGAHFLHGDGHVAFVTEQMEPRLYRKHARLRPDGRD
ncbi:MAG: DUF1559 domain-containing protein [Planctomycetota bacterium]